MTQATDSYVAMFRAMIALAWVDHELEAEEQESLRHYISGNVRLSDQQKQTLLASVNRKTSLCDSWGEITNPRDRAHLINLASTLFHEDHCFEPEERRVFERISNLHDNTLDAESLRTELQSMAKASRERLKAEDEAYMQSLSVPARILTYLDLTQEYPEMV